MTTVSQAFLVNDPAESNARCHMFARERARVCDMCVGGVWVHDYLIRIPLAIPRIFFFITKIFVPPIRSRVLRGTYGSRVRTIDRSNS